MAIDCAVINIDLIIIGHIHQLVAAFHKPRTLCERLQQQELCHRERDVFAFPGNGMTQRVHFEVTTVHDFGFFCFGDHFASNRILTAQKRTDALNKKTLGKRLFDVVVSAHAQAKHLVDLIVF